MDASTAMTVLAGFTADQWGLVTAAQANAAGVDNATLARLVRAGLLEHVRRGAYAATAAGEDALRPQRAAWLLLNPAVPAWQRPRLDPDGGVLSHRTAALIHGLGDLVTDTTEITVPRRRASKHPDITFRRATLDDDDVTILDGLPVTTVERTIDDLLADHIDGGHAGDIIEQALRRDQADLDTLTARVARHAQRYRATGGGRGLVEHLLGQSSSPTAQQRLSISPAASAALARAVSEAYRPALLAALAPMNAALQQQLRGIVDTEPMRAQLSEAIASSIDLTPLRRAIARIAGARSTDTAGHGAAPRAGHGSTVAPARGPTDYAAAARRTAEQDPAE